MEPNQKSSSIVPISIILGFGMIALAVYFSGGSQTTAVKTGQQASVESAPATEAPRPVDETDYIRGNPNAPILMVEYSDYDCPYCKQFHATMNQIMNEYGVTGQLAWVYRQFPLAQLHPNAPIIAEAALCVGDIGGNEAFWTFTNQVFKERGIDEFTNMTRLTEYVDAIGIPSSEYTSCVENRQMKDRLESDITSGFNSGARGTPYTIISVGDQQAVVSGAQSYTTVKTIVENLLSQLEGNFDFETDEPIESSI